MPRLGTTAQFLNDAFVVLEEDVLAAFVCMGESLNGVVVNVSINGENFQICSEPSLCVRPGSSQNAPITLAMERAALIDLVEGESRLITELRRGRIIIRGPSAALLKLARAQHAFTEGAVRTGRMVALFSRFKESV